MRMRQRGLLRYVMTAAAVFCCVPAALAGPPETYAGKPVRAEEWTISGGGTALFYATDDGFIPMSTDRVTINGAGPGIKAPRDGSAPSYVWTFALRFADDASPKRITIEDVTGAEADTLVDQDDVRPEVVMAVSEHGISTIGGADWTASSAARCEIARDNACSAWIFRDGPYYWRLRLTIEYRDGHRETIYQGAKFETAGLRAQLGLGE